MHFCICAQRLVEYHLVWSSYWSLIHMLLLSWLAPVAAAPMAAAPVTAAPADASPTAVVAVAAAFSVAAASSWMPLL
jgi:hypothetical protein